jgi:hypothetical protein
MFSYNGSSPKCKIPHLVERYFAYFSHVCDNPEQGAHYHNLGLHVWSFLADCLAGYKVGKFIIYHSFCTMDYTYFSIGKCALKIVYAMLPLATNMFCLPQTSLGTSYSEQANL